MSSILRRFLMSFSASLALGGVAAAADCDALVTNFKSAIADKAFDKVKDAMGTIADDNACNFDIDKHRIQEINSVIDMAWAQREDGGYAEKDDRVRRRNHGSRRRLALGRASRRLSKLERFSPATPVYHPPERVTFGFRRCPSQKGSRGPCLNKSGGARRSGKAACLGDADGQLHLRPASIPSCAPAREKLETALIIGVALLSVADYASKLSIGSMSGNGVLALKRC